MIQNLHQYTVRESESKNKNLGSLDDLSSQSNTGQVVESGANKVV
ncbi:14320_t:CDS:1, partial [Funneliformis mosseae]